MDSFKNIGITSTFKDQLLAQEKKEQEVDFK